MSRLRISEIFEEGKAYDILTTYKEVPIKAILKLNWIDDEGRLLGFDWGKINYRRAFSTLPVYVKVDNREYAKTQVFSNLGKELVLMVDTFVPPPDFIRRKFVRVEPDDEKPVLVELLIDNLKTEARAKDVSESGVGVVLNAEDDRDFINKLKEMLEHLRENEDIEFSMKINLPDVGVAKGKGKLRNVIGLGRDVYVRMGFEMDLPKQEINKIRRYVMNRQKEIIQSLRMLK